MVTTEVSTQAQPIGYLVGTSYCGSTLMAFLMDCHSQVVSVGETSPNRKARQNGARTMKCSCGAPLYECSFWQQISDRLAQSGSCFSIDEWNNDFRYLNPALHKLLHAESSNRVRQYLSVSADRWLPFHNQRIARINEANFDFVRTAVDLANARVFFDTSKGIDRLLRLMRYNKYDLRVIYFVRDVRAFAFHGKRKGTPIESMSRRWLDFHTNALRFFRQSPELQVLTVKYEDLCAEPVEWLAKIHEHLGVPPEAPPETIDATQHHILGNSMRLGGELRIELNEKWREGLSPDEVDRALRVAGELNRELGYA